MDHKIYFKDLFDSIPDYRKIVLLLSLNQNESDLLKKCGYIKNDIDSLYKSWKI